MLSITSLHHWLGLNNQHLKKALLTSILHEFFRLFLYIIIALFISALLAPTPFQDIKIATFTVIYLTASALNALLNHFSNHYWGDITQSTLPHLRQLITDTLSHSQHAHIDALKHDLEKSIKHAENHLFDFFNATCNQLTKNIVGLILIATCLFTMHDHMAMVLTPIIFIPPLFILLKSSPKPQEKTFNSNGISCHLVPFSSSTHTTEPSTAILNPKYNAYSSYLVTNAIGFLVLFLIGSHEYALAQLTPLSLLITLFFIPQLSRLSIKLTQNGLKLQKTLSSLRTLVSLLDSLNKNPPKKNGTLAFHSNDPIVLNGIYFQSFNQQPILQDIHVHIGMNPIAIQGAAKSGKSTLLKIITQWYENAMGEIQIGDHAAQDINRTLMYDKIGWADCSDMITSVSIQEWLTQNTAKTASEMDKALSMAYCDFAHEKPQKTQTPIDQLSYDERQKLKLAHMILKHFMSLMILL